MVNVPSFTPSTSFPQLCDKVIVDYDSKRGRHVRALEAIPVGTVVCVEKGITVNIDPTRCYGCLAETEAADYAYCANCEEAFEPDCLALGDCDDLGIFKLAAHLVFTYPFAEIVKLVDVDEPEPATCAPSSLSTFDIASVLQLKPSPEVLETFQAGPVQKRIEKMLKELDDDANWGRLDMKTRWVAFTSALRIMVERCAKNAHTVYSIEQIQKISEKKPMGTGLFPIASIFNHSCAPNVFGFFINNTFIFVSRGIQAGEELVDSYGVTVWEHTYQQRAGFLSTVSGFQCHCDSCVNQISRDDLLEKAFNDMEKCAQEADSFLDIHDYLDFLRPGSKDIENLIIAFSQRTDAEIFPDASFERWKEFIENAKIRGIDNDPYLIRPYIELLMLAYNDDVPCSDAEKSSFLVNTQRLLHNFYADLHPLSNIVNTFMDKAASGNFRLIRPHIERMKCMTRMLWYSDDRVDSDED